jgi:hypothetical protein
MFHVASKKVPLFHDQGDANETNIVVDNCLINKLINPKAISRISFLSSHASTKRMSKQTSSKCMPGSKGKV